MSMAELIRELAALPSERQDELAAYLLHLRLERNPAWRTEMTQRIDNHQPGQWVSLDDWKTELKAATENP
ncbi:MAG: hypothetical protein EBS05_16735 [Proteobacteria bacterium]|nr:hypothetical protein [Pseudomonadota bacterium]